MPLRRHFILHDAKRRFVNEMAWFQLRTKMGTARLPVPPINPEVTQYLSAVQMYVDAHVDASELRRPRGMPSWRKEIPVFATALYDAGHGVDLRVFHSRKHARPSRSKLHAVRSAA
jgi:hypothetical protein